MIDINEVKKDKKFDETKLLEYGFVKREGGYVFLKDLDSENDILLLVTVSLDLSGVTDMVIDNAVGEEYMPMNNLAVQGPYVNRIRAQRDNEMLNIFGQCVEDDMDYKPANSQEPIYLIPEQVEDLKEQLLKKQKELEECQRLHRNVVENRSKKVNGSESLGSVMDNSGVYDAAKIQEEIDGILMKLKDYQCPKPFGDSAQIGSFVTYRDVCDGRNQGVTRTVIIIAGDMSPKARNSFRDEGLRVATVDSALGQALIGRTANDVIEFSVGDGRGNCAIKHVAFIEDVDNKCIYERYEMEGPNESIGSHGVKSL